MQGLQMFLVACLCLSVFIISVDAQCRPCMGCGNGKCEVGENCRTCPGDCGLCPTCANRCGNNICESALGENACNCPRDCGNCCVDGNCREDMGETFGNCPADCGVTLQLRPIDAETKESVLATVTCRSPWTSAGPSSAATQIHSFVVPGGMYNCTAENDPQYWPGTVSVAFYTKSCPTVFPIPLRYRWGCITGDAYNLVTLQRLPGVTVTCTGTSRPAARFTGTMGQFHFDRLLPGNYTCVGTLASYANAVGTVEILPGGNCPRLDLYLRPLPGAIQGYTTDASGKVLNDVSIVCFVQTNPLLRNVTSTAGPGFYQIQNFDSGLATCQASLTGYTTQSKFGFVPQGGVLELNFTLSLLPANLNGFVYDTASPLGLPGAVVTCGATLGASTTPTDGSFAYANIPPETYTCTASKAGYTVSTPAAPVTLGPGESKSVVIIMTPAPSTVNVKVINRDTSAGVNGATVNCVFSDPTIASITNSATNSNGDIPAYTFTINKPAVTSLTYTCTGSAPGFGSGSATGTPPSVGRGGSSSAVISLVFLSINVTVREDTGTTRPLLTGATVVCVNGAAGSTPLTSTTTATGFVSFPGVLPGSYNCSATKTGYTYNSTAFAMTITSGSVGVELTINVPRFLIQGVVLDPINTTTPIPGLQVVFGFPETNTAFTINTFTQKFGVSTYWSFMHTLPVSINFSISVVGSTLAVPTLIDTKIYTINNYNAPTRVPTILLFEYSASQIVGTIRNTASGSGPIRAVAIAAQSTTSATRIPGVYNNATGDYTIGNLAVGTYTLSFSADGFTPATIPNIQIVRLGQTVTVPVQLTAPTTGSISGNITGGANPLVGATITVIAGGNTFTTVSGAGGVWSILNVTADPAAIVAGSFTGYRSTNFTVTISAGGATTGTLLALAPKSSSVGGAVLGVQGATATSVFTLNINVLVCLMDSTFVFPSNAGSLTTCINTPGFSGRSAVVGSTGYQFNDVAEGTYFVFAVPSAGGVVPTASASFNIVEGSPQTVDIRMNRT